MGGKEQGGRQAEGQWPITPLWKGSLASSADRPGVAWKWERASACSRLRLRKGCPQPGPSSQFLLLRRTELQEGTQGGGVRLARGRGTVTAPALDPAPRAAPGPKPFHATKEGGASSLAIQPHREDQRGADRQRQARPHVRGHPAQHPSQEGSLALQPTPYRFSPGWYWGSVDVK